MDKYELIEQLTEAIKKEPVYLNYIEKRNILENHQIMTEINTLQRLLQEKEDLKSYSQYIDLTELNEKIKNQRLLIDNEIVVKAYKKANADLNNYLDDISQIIFSDISEDLIIGRLGKLYARHSR